jgi:hypothetical protein
VSSAVGGRDGGRWDHLEHVPSARILREKLSSDATSAILHRNVLNVAPLGQLNEWPDVLPSGHSFELRHVAHRVPRVPFAGDSEESAATAVVESHDKWRPVNDAPVPFGCGAFHLPRAGRWGPFHEAINWRSEMIQSIEGPKRPTTPLFSQIGPLRPAPMKWPQRAPLCPPLGRVNLANGRADSSADPTRPMTRENKRRTALTFGVSLALVFAALGPPVLEPDLVDGGGTPMSNE